MFSGMLDEVSKQQCLPSLHRMVCLWLLAALSLTCRILMPHAILQQADLEINMHLSEFEAHMQLHFSLKLSRDYQDLVRISLFTSECHN